MAASASLSLRRSTIIGTFSPGDRFEYHQSVRDAFLVRGALLCCAVNFFGSGFLQEFWRLRLGDSGGGELPRVCSLRKFGERGATGCWAEKCPRRSAAATSAVAHIKVNWHRPSPDTGRTG